VSNSSYSNGAILQFNMLHENQQEHKMSEVCSLLKAFDQLPSKHLAVRWQLQQPARIGETPQHHLHHHHHTTEPSRRSKAERE
jgi:hypothetical protein